MKKRKPRKPKSFKSGEYTSAGIDWVYFNGGIEDQAVYIGGQDIIDIQQIYVLKNDVRKLAAWLLKAADYLESKGAK